MILKVLKRILNVKSRPACYIMKKLSTSVTDEVILEKIGNKGVITLNRPKALNALNLPMIRKIYPQLKVWEADPTMKMIIIKGTGEKAFCAGGDIRAIALATKNGDPLTEDFFREEYQLNFLTGTIQLPYVALIDGITMGGGVGLSVHGQFRVATERTVFAMPETAIGFFPDVGGSHFLSHLPGKLGLYLALTGFRLTGHDVLKAGIATHFVNSSRIKTVEEDLIRMDSPSTQEIDKLLCKNQEQSIIEKKDFVLKHTLGKINTLFEGDSLKVVIENLTKDNSEWAKQQLQILAKMSPTSLKVTFHQLELGKSMTLQECLKMEYRISQRFMKGHDFYEGVRSVLIDKDNKPVWKPATVEDVSDNVIEEYFALLSKDKELVL